MPYTAEQLSHFSGRTVELAQALLDLELEIRRGDADPEMLSRLAVLKRQIEDLGEVLKRRAQPDG